MRVVCFCELSFVASFHVPTEKCPFVLYKMLKERFFPIFVLLCRLELIRLKCHSNLNCCNLISSSDAFLDSSYINIYFELIITWN